MIEDGIDLVTLAGGPALTPQQRKALFRKGTGPKGYAAPPGTGPAGETCKSCRHYYRREFSKVYLKCGLMRVHWTGGRRTDILAGSPACQKWEAPSVDEQHERVGDQKQAANACDL